MHEDEDENEDVGMKEAIGDLWSLALILLTHFVIINASMRQALGRHCACPIVRRYACIKLSAPDRKRAEVARRWVVRHPSVNSPHILLARPGRQ
jgi:hypothetical protein